MPEKLTREEIERRLLALDRSPGSGRPATGSHGYSPGPPPSHWVYVCPTCGRRTAYLVDAEDEIRWYREERAGEPVDAERKVSGRKVSELVADTESALWAARDLPAGKGVRVDESALCAVCSPDAQSFEPLLENPVPGG